MPSMNFSHWNHSMIAKDKYIYAIGGYNSNKCEYYDIDEHKWESMPNLNCEERQRPILAINNDYLYSFMGYIQFNILDIIERINITNLNNGKWEKVIFSNPDNVNIKFYGAGIFNYNEELYFFGGKEGFGNEDKDYKIEIISFDFKKFEFKKNNFYYLCKLNFIENELFIMNDNNLGNFIESNEGCLATINVSSLFNN